MNETNTIIDIVQSNIQNTIGHYVWLFIIGVIGLIFKSSIEKFVCALFVFFGHDYKEDDVVYVNGAPGRIVRIGFIKTTFFIYEVKDGKVIGGKKLVVQNEQLKNLNIEKPLDNLDLTKFNK
jgi:hypothetical protein